MKYLKILFIIVSAIILLVLIGMTIGWIIAFIQDRLDSTFLWILLILLIVGSLVFLKRLETQQKKEQEKNLTQYLALGKILFKEQAEEFEAVYKNYQKSSKAPSDNIHPVEVLYDFADLHKACLTIDWRGDDEGEIEEFITGQTAAELSWTNTRSLRAKYMEEKRDGKFIIKLFKAIDRDLKEINARLLFMDLGNDSYTILLTDINTFSTVKNFGSKDFYGTEKWKGG